MIATNSNHQCFACVLKQMGANERDREKLLNNKESLNRLKTAMSAQNREIKFYSVSDDFGEFSNFASFPIQLKGKTWPTSEHYFQAQKFRDKKHQSTIRKEKSPMQAARMGRDRKKPLRKDWESIKVSIMREAVLAKFTQYNELKDLLISTGDAKIIEHTTNDAYWGDGGNGSGKNMLGRILMEVREQLKAVENQGPFKGTEPSD